MKLTPIFPALAASVLLVTSCARYVKTASQTTAGDQAIRPPASWSAASRGDSGKISSGWLREFHSSAMTSLVLEAVNKNPNLNAAAARLRSAKHGTIGSRAAQLPRLTAATSASQSRNGNGNSASSSNESYGLSLNSSWEADLWGRLRDLRSADLASYYATEANYRSARLSLAANTAKAYCDLVTSQQLLELARETLDSFEKNRDIVERNYKAGVPGTRALAVQLSRTNVASAQRNIKSRELSRDNAARTLESLLGRYPSSTITASNELPNLSVYIPADIPANLVSRRPDLIAAQHTIFQSAKLADASAKNLLPSLSLTSRASTSDSTPRSLLNPQFIASNIAASLTQSIYRGGELKADARAALERNREAIYNYSDLSIRAFREVENAISADTSLAEQEAFLIQENKQATFAERSAELDYSEGIDNSGILEILESQRRATSARAALINLRNTRLQNRIDLHLALGGDFHTNPAQ